ncbi:MAG: hypothetical protein AAGI68_07275 [Planctomycetota bacterium]
MTTSVTQTGWALDQPRETEGYARARLVLGMSGVGLWVVLCVAGLVFGVSGWVPGVGEAGFGGHALAWGIVVLVYSTVMLPLDVLGGWVLPRRYGRDEQVAGGAGGFAKRLTRGVVAYGLLLWLSGLLVLGMAGWLGVWGVVGGVAAGCVVMLIVRPWWAGVVARLRAVEGPAPGRGLATRWVASEDGGFTGGIVGWVVGARKAVMPAGMIGKVDDAGLERLMARRAAAVSSGLWRRGQLVAMLFTVVGVAGVALWVGGERLASAAGVLELAMGFTLWSFLGLLTLPTLSRRAVLQLDREWDDAGEGLSAEVELDLRRDGEAKRRGVIEAIFHPIPDRASRESASTRTTTGAAYDAARSAIYLGVAGLGLLGRAVHCNVGRPALWVWLPTD